MRTTIEELYYGNIMSYNRSVRAGSEHVNLVGLLARNEAELPTEAPTESETEAVKRGCKSVTFSVVAVLAVGAVAMALSKKKEF